MAKKTGHKANWLRIATYVPEEIHDAVVEKAKKEMLSVSDVVRFAITDSMKQNAEANYVK